jgi:hypothetical protein
MIADKIFENGVYIEVVMVGVIVGIVDGNYIRFTGVSVTEAIWA